MKRLCLYTVAAAAITENHSCHQITELLKLEKTTETIEGNPVPWQVTKLRQSVSTCLVGCWAWQQKQKTGIIRKYWWYWMSSQATWLPLWTRPTLHNTGAWSDPLHCLVKLLKQRALTKQPSWALKGWVFKTQLILLQFFLKKGNFSQRLIAGSETSSPSDGFTSWEAIFLYFMSNSLC